MAFFVVFGLGVSGVGAVSFLKQNKLPFVCVDESIGVDEKNGVLGSVEILTKKTKEISEQIFIVLSPGVPTYYPKKHKIIEYAERFSAKIISDIDLVKMFHHSAKFIGITGTNGKSTTTSLISFLLSSFGVGNSCGGNIGKSLLDDDVFKKNENYVIEVSSYQSELISFGFDYSIITNISEDHLERHKTMENYINAKKKLISNSLVKVIGVDDQHCFSIYNQVKSAGNTYAFSVNRVLDDGYSLFDGVFYKDRSPICNVESFVNLPGVHNLQNILAASIICSKVCGVDNFGLIFEKARLFKGLEHRIEFVCKKANISVINDSKATNVNSTEVMLPCFKNIYLICGGKMKDQGIEYFINTKNKYFDQNVLKVFLYGECENIFSQRLKDLGYKRQFNKYQTIDAAFNAAYAEALTEKAEINIVLSPMCASFDQFKNFEHRGCEFKKIALSTMGL